jgi:hypothetical protein
MPRRKSKEIVQVKIRLHASVLAQLKAATKNAGHSFNEEAAMRLGRSFGEEKQFGGAVGRRWVDFLTSAFVFAGEQYYRNQLSRKQKPPPNEGPDVSKWIDDPEVYAAAMMNVIEQLMFRQPGVTYEKCIEQWNAHKGVIASHFVKQPGWQRIVDKEGGK